MIRDRLAAFLYWAAYWLERAADRVWYGKSGRTHAHPYYYDEPTRGRHAP